MTTGLSGFLGVDLGAIFTTGITGATAIINNNTQLQIAQANLAAEQNAATAATAVANSNSANVNLLVTGGLVLAAAVIAVRVLRRR